MLDATNLGLVLLFPEGCCSVEPEDDDEGSEEEWGWGWEEEEEEEEEGGGGGWCEPEEGESVLPELSLFLARVLRRYCTTTDCFSSPMRVKCFMT